MTEKQKRQAAILRGKFLKQALQENKNGNVQLRGYLKDITQYFAEMHNIQLKK